MRIAEGVIIGAAAVAALFAVKRGTSGTGRVLQPRRAPATCNCGYDGPVMSARGGDGMMHAYCQWCDRIKHIMK